MKNSKHKMRCFRININGKIFMIRTFTTPKAVSKAVRQYLGNGRCKSKKKIIIKIVKIWDIDSNQIRARK
jgi:hypothetical protein